MFGLLCYQNVTNMPRYKEPFTIFPRKLKSGKIVYYYRTYTPDGVRTVAHSTGKSNKTQARCYCAELLKQGLLYSGAGMSFKAYAFDFFSENGQWYQDKVQAGTGKEQPVAKNTLKAYIHNCNDIIVPYFSKKKICDIKPSHIRQFRSLLLEKSFSNSAINLACACLHIIISYALADKLISADPFESVGRMYINAKSRKSFTKEQLKEMFSRWKSSDDKRLFVLIAACTGLRISEICAIRAETVHEEYIDVKDQLLGRELCAVKDGEKRKVRICGFLREMLSEQIKKSTRFVFPLNQDAYRSVFYKELGIADAERKEKGLSFHSLRHFFNTYLAANNIAEIKIKATLGHSSGKGSMTERYTNFTPDDFSDIAELQTRLVSYFCR